MPRFCLLLTHVRWLALDEVETHSFGVQLVPGLRQNFVHASLVHERDKSETPRQRGDQNYNTSTHSAYTDNTAINKPLWRLLYVCCGFPVRLVVPLPGALCNWIPHHHALLHLTKLTEVVFQTL